MEPPSDEASWNLFNLAYAFGVTAAGAFITWLARVQKPKPPVEASISGALVDNRAVDPLIKSFDELINTNRSVIASNHRMIELMEQEVGLRQSTVEEQRRLEERKALKLAIADEVREDILAEIRNDIAKTAPAPMPPIRKPRGAPDA